MPTPANPNPASDIHSHSNTSGGSPVAAKDLPNTRDDQTPKHPTSSDASRINRVADKAAHKAAKEEQEYDAEKGIISH